LVSHDYFHDVTVQSFRLNGERARCDLRASIAAMAARYAVPTVCFVREFTAAGGWFRHHGLRYDLIRPQQH
jgi:hypothetical protein